MKVTEQMIYAYAGEPEITATDAHAIEVGIQAVLDHIERESISYEPFVTWAAIHCTTEDTDAWNNMVDAWEKLPNSIRTRLLEGRKA